MKISIKSARVNKGLTQEKAAKTIGVDKKTLSSWENYKTMPSADKIVLLCNLYDVPYDNIRWNPA